MQFDKFKIFKKNLVSGRFLSGLGCGLATPAIYLSLSDLSVIQSRGIMAVSSSLINNAGFLSGLVAGAGTYDVTIIIEEFVVQFHRSHLSTQ